MGRLDYPTPGSAYIANSAVEWKSALLNWLNQQLVHPALMIRMDELMLILQDQEIVFLQNRKLSEAPIKAFIEYYQKELKKEFKYTLQIEYIE